MATNSSGFDAAAVSYTHLDVYKRQVSSRSSAVKYIFAMTASPVLDVKEIVLAI